jgi:hypothetical protein
VRNVDYWYQANSETNTGAITLSSIDLTDQFLGKKQKRNLAERFGKITTNLIDIYFSFNDALKPRFQLLDYLQSQFSTPQRQRLQCQKINASIIMVQLLHLIPLLGRQPMPPLTQWHEIHPRSR